MARSTPKDEKNVVWEKRQYQNLVGNYHYPTCMTGNIDICKTIIRRQLSEDQLDHKRDEDEKCHLTHLKGRSILTH